LAAESVVAEFVLSESCDLASVYRSYATGLPPLCTFAPDWPSPARLAAEAGYQTLLVSDDECLATSDFASSFSDSLLVTSQQAPQLAREVRSTATAVLFQAAAEELGRLAQPGFLWLHAGGLNTAWDAPYELRERLADEDDPSPPQLITLPSLVLPKGYDPDELLGYVQAYAAEITALDESLAALLASIDETCDPANTLVVFTSPRGFPLGEHGAVGPTGDSLCGEVLQVPLLVRFPGRQERLMRLPGLHQGVDLWRTLAGRLGYASEAGWGVDLLAVATGNQNSHPFTFASRGNDLAIRTSDWFYRQEYREGEPRIELYAKPDDRWEVNEVSQRASHVVESFGGLATWLRTQAGLPARPSLPQLPEGLLRGR
jgi:membrane-anchored protein YejM (alkaline phosphatase superfamily)